MFHTTQTERPIKIPDCRLFHSTLAHSHTRCADGTGAKKSHRHDANSPSSPVVPFRFVSLSDTCTRCELLELITSFTHDISHKCLCVFALVTYGLARSPYANSQTITSPFAPEKCGPLFVGTRRKRNMQKWQKCNEREKLLQQKRRKKRAQRSPRSAVHASHVNAINEAKPKKRKMKSISCRRRFAKVRTAIPTKPRKKNIPVCTRSSYCDTIIVNYLLLKHLSVCVCETG